MIKIQAASEDAAKREAVRISLEHSGRYVEIASCFGLFAILNKRLSVETVGDSHYDWYALNGKIKKFTEKQKAAYTNYCLDGKN